MKELTIVSLFAILAVAFDGGVALAQSIPTNAPVCATNHCPRPQANVPAKIRLLLSKNRSGGYALTAAIQNLLQSDPCAIADIIQAVSSQANPEQALAAEQGVLQAMAQMKSADPVGAQTVHAYFDCEHANAVVGQILAAELSQGSNQGGNGQRDNDHGGPGGGNSQGGGGFAGGGCGNGNSQGNANASANGASNGCGHVSPH